MTYVVVENCIKCKYMDCVEVCPVDCFYEGENMLVIHPDECIDCGVCEPECPAEAIKPDTEPGLEKWLKLNAEYAKSWPNISVKREGPADGKEFDGKPGSLKPISRRTPGGRLRPGPADDDPAFIPCFAVRPQGQDRGASPGARRPHQRRRRRHDQETDSIRRENPLGKIPTLILEDARALRQPGHRGLSRPSRRRRPA